MGFPADPEFVEHLREIGATFGPEAAPRRNGKPDRPRRRASHVAGVMNATERRFSEEHLVPWCAAGEILGWEFEPQPPLVLSAAARVSYLPDFAVWMPDGSKRYYEIKGGYAREDSIIKLRWAAQAFPENEFRLCVHKNGGWKITLVPHD